MTSYVYLVFGVPVMIKVYIQDVDKISHFDYGLVGLHSICIKKIKQ